MEYGNKCIWINIEVENMRKSIMSAEVCFVFDIFSSCKILASWKYQMGNSQQTGAALLLAPSHKPTTSARRTESFFNGVKEGIFFIKKSWNKYAAEQYHL